MTEYDDLSAERPDLAALVDAEAVRILESNPEFTSSVKPDFINGRLIDEAMRYAHRGNAELRQWRADRRSDLGLHVEAAARAMVARRQQGLPEKVEDASALARVASILLAGDPALYAEDES